jgi:glyoxylase-like metal-dependent hydrolase (beta-lactamase superfamily II)
MKPNQKHALRALAVPAGTLIVLSMASAPVLAAEEETTEQTVETITYEAQESTETSADDVQPEETPAEQEEEEEGVLVGDKQDALESISVKKVDAEGNDIEMTLTEDTIEQVNKIGTEAVKAEVIADEDGQVQAIKVNAQLKDVYLQDTSITGVTDRAHSYYNLIDFQAQVIQVDNLVEQTLVDRIIDSADNEVSAQYVKSLLELLNQINTFDPKTNLKYDWESVYNSETFAQTQKGALDVIATSADGLASFEFHLDTGGHWGYDLAYSSKMSEIVGSTDDNGEALTGNKFENDHALATSYANFFVITMKEDENGTWYMLDDTDLENPMIYVSADGKQALMIDVDFYGENVLNSVIKSVIGEQCEDLKIFMTHNHGDHTLNLSVIAQDDALRSITTIYWPENEPHTTNNDVDLVDDLGWKEVYLLKDQETFTVGSYEFLFNEILNEHTPGGGQLIDLTNKVLYSGDTLGAQVHLGGTTISLSAAKQWIAGAQKTQQVIADNDVDYIIGGHTPYLNTTDFAKWLEVAINYAVDAFEADPSFSGLVIVKDGEVVEGKEKAALLASGANDREELHYLSVNFRNDLYKQADKQAALESISVKKVDANGNDIEMTLTEDTINQVNSIGTAAVTGVLNEAKDTLTVNAKLKDVYLKDTSITGVTDRAHSYYNLLDFYAQVIQVNQLVQANGVETIVDSENNVLSAQYVASLLELLEQINAFDPTTNLQYDWESVYNSETFNETEKGALDVIATSKDGFASFEFHLDTGGHWGYDLAYSSKMSEIVGSTDDNGEALTGNKFENDHALATSYANFFVITMKSDENGTWYMLDDTDLENPMIYVSADGKQALMIDVDFYGENVLNSVIKSVIGNQCEELKIFLTHNHLDHTYNLEKIYEDEYLRSIVTLYWPENEPHTVKGDMDLVELFGKRVHLLEDQEKFSVGSYEFVFNEIGNEHTPGGGQLIDLTNKVLYSGDTLGAQVHLGGTTFALSAAQQWLEGALKTTAAMEEYGAEYIVGGHTPYLNTADFAKWLATAAQYALDQYAADPTFATAGRELIIVKDGKVLSDEEKAAVIASGANDREELHYLSINVYNDLYQEPEPSQPEPSDPSEVVTPTDPETPSEVETPTTPETPSDESEDKTQPENPEEKDENQEKDTEKKDEETVNNTQQTPATTASVSGSAVNTSASLGQRGFMATLAASLGAALALVRRKED